MAPPPLLYLGALALGLGLHLAFPVRVLPHGMACVVGGLACLVSVALGGSGLWELRRAGTSQNPRKPTTAVVVSGPFRISRNPLYLSLLCLYVGVAFLVDSLWLLLLAVPLIAVLRVAVIGPEERYLERKFGDEYRRYRSRVRRWL
ncbi:MAG TPA: isoprenylcysteine carboxylmethyltransferase family protein [Candidatus Methylomirabilis sp.]|nr:isoprenylcysteine carboxylmethyltransferase family protein [Candidatus Methylomirabilis sp.]